MWFCIAPKAKNRVPKLECCIIELTLSCNLDCIHCWSYAWDSRHNELSLDEIFKLIDDLKKIKCEQITLMWWEFLLRKEWYEIAKYIKSKKINLVIISNGLALGNKKIFEKIAELQPYSVAISIDWMKKTHDYIRWINGSFDKAISSIRLLIDNNISVGIITTLSKINYKELPKLKNLFYKLKSPVAWQIQTACHWNKLTREMLVEQKEFLYICKFIEKMQIEDKYREKKMLVAWADDIWYCSQKISPAISIDNNWQWCKAWIYVLWVQSNWNVKWCLSLPDEFIEWNIREKSIVDIWKDKNFCDFSRNFKESMLGDNCKWCEFWEKCKWWCIEVSYSRTWEKYNSPLCLYRMWK